MRHIARRVLLVVTAVLVFAGVSGIQRIQRDPSAQSVLDDARAFVRTNPSARFSGTVNQFFIAGEFESPRRGHVVVTSGDNAAAETLALDDVTYTRSAETTATLGKVQYETSDAARSERPAGGISRRGFIDVQAWLAAAHHPKATFRAGDSTNITTDVDVAKLYGAVEARRVDWMTLRMTVRKGGEIRSLVQVTRDEVSGTTTITLRFTEWGKFVVAAPPAEQIDPTPGIHEAEIAAFEDSALYMPRQLPAGWKLLRAGVLAEEETVEGCAQVELEYGPTDGPSHARLSLYEFPNSCAQALGGERVQPFSAGAYRGFGRSSDEEGTVVQVTVGVTTIQASSPRLSLDEVAALLRDLVRLKL